MKRSYAAPMRKVYPPAVWRTKTTIPVIPMNQALGQVTGYFGVFPTALRTAATHFHPKKNNKINLKILKI